MGGGIFCTLRCHGSGACGVLYFLSGSFDAFGYDSRSCAFQTFGGRRRIAFEELVLFHGDPHCVYAPCDDTAVLGIVGLYTCKIYFGICFLCVAYLGILYARKTFFF